MAFFLKKSSLKKGVYLQIYRSFYDPDKKQTAHSSYKALGYVSELQQNGIADPISYFQEEVGRLNLQYRQQKAEARVKQISEESPEKFLGYFPLKNLNDALGVKRFLDLMQSVTDFRFNVFSLISSLVYARVVSPCSKLRTFEDVLPSLFEDCSFSKDQLYDGLDYIGEEYEKIIEIYNDRVKSKFGFNTDHTYFDCTNFYFEIDAEDPLRRKGPSKEQRNDPIVGMGLLLDADQIPIGMKIYPGNESEKPLLRNIVDDLKRRNAIGGRTIRVADKGLNCAENILHARKVNDGYIFSKSVKSLPEVERKWILLDNDYIDVTDKSGNVLYRYKECTDKFPYAVTLESGAKRTVELTEKRIVTFNPKLAQKQTFEIKRQIEKIKKLRYSGAKRSEYGDCAKYVSFVSKDAEGNKSGNTIDVELNRKNIDRDLQLAGYNLLVTSEIKMPAKEIYATYHNLWRIEESFRIMKSDLNTRPVYLQKKNTITAHFLICYLAVLLLRLLQFKVLKEEFSSGKLIRLMKTLRVVKISDTKYVNLARKTNIIDRLTDITMLPLTSYYLSTGQIKKVLNHRF